MRFEEVYESWTKKCLTQEEAAELSQDSAPTPFQGRI